MSEKAVPGSISDTYTERAFMDFMEAKRQNADAKNGSRRLQQCQYETLFPCSDENIRSGFEEIMDVPVSA